jgi:hypothetical protein
VPINFGCSTVSCGIPGGDFRFECVEVWDASIETLSGEGGEFDFGHIEPRAMFWPMVNLQAGKQAACLFRLEGLVKSGWLMGKVELPKMDATGDRKER